MVEDSPEDYLVTLFHNTICRAQLFCPFFLSASEYLSNMLFSYHLLYFCIALSLIIMLSSHYHHHKSKTFSQLTQCPFTGTLLLLLLLISPTLADRVQTYLDFINSPKNETIQLKCIGILFSHHCTPFIAFIVSPARSGDTMDSSSSGSSCYCC